MIPTAGGCGHGNITAVKEYSGKPRTAASEAQLSDDRKLAEEAHISKGTINQLESGQSNVTLEKLYRVCKHFNIPMSQLLDEPAEVPEIKDLRDVNRQIEAIYACLDHIQKYIQDRLDELDQ